MPIVARQNCNVTPGLRGMFQTMKRMAQITIEVTRNRREINGHDFIDNYIMSIFSGLNYRRICNFSLINFPF